MGEGEVAAMATAAWIGAVIAWPLPLPAPVVVVVTALLTRRPLLLVVGVGLLASAVGHRADAAYQPVTATRSTDAVATVLDDPRPVAGGWSATLRLPDGARVQARGWGRAGFELSTASAGDRLVAVGRLKPVDDSPWARSRHLVGRLQLTSAEVSGPPTGARSLVEAVRDRVVAGADVLPERLRPLYLGLVVGEDRFQPPEQRARFAAAGLSHLLAVSGQNVAFVLAVLRPVTDRLGRRARFVATIGVLAGFAVATRLEPSVLRATVVAGLATFSALGGHRQSGVRLLGLAVTALLLIDPFLVHSIGFQLSVAASAGILLLSPALARRLPLPSPIAEAVSVTVGAQLAVTPIIGRAFGPVSLVAVPANLLAGWAAGLVMMWGLTVGVVAGVVGGAIGSGLQLPATVATAWLDAVAAWAARVPAPAASGWSIASAMALVGAVRLLVRRSSRDDPDGQPPRRQRGPSGPHRAFRRLVVVGAVVVAGTALVETVPRPPASPVALDGDGWFVPSSAGAPSVLVVGDRAHESLLDSLLEARITSIDVVVVEAGSGRTATVARAVASLVPTGVILAPPLHRLVGGTRVTDELVLAAGGTTLTITPDGRRLRVAGDPLGPPS